MSVYLLFEHQSSPDPWLRLRLLRYCCRIREADQCDDPARRDLRPIIPIVFYQGALGWDHSTEFSDLFREATRALPWLPRLTHELIDQTTLTPEAVAGDIKGRIAQLLMMVAFDRHVDRALLLAARLTLSLSRAGGGPDEFRRYFLYLASTQDRETVERFGEALRHQGLQQGDEIMTYVEEVRAEVQVKMVEGLLRVGVTWDVIEAATGLTETEFQKLKAQLTGLGS